MVVKSGASSPSGTMQEEDTSVGGGSNATYVVWRATGKVMTKLVIAENGYQFECDFQPDVIDYTFPLKVGRSWSGSTSCTTRFLNETVTTHLSYNGRVVRRDQLTVASSAVAVWVIASTTHTTSVKDQKSYQSSTEQMDYFSPKYGVSVRVETKTTGPRGNTLIRRQLLGLQPA